jgi:hypothetical protein
MLRARKENKIVTKGEKNGRSCEAGGSGFTDTIFKAAKKPEETKTLSGFENE